MASYVDTSVVIVSADPVARRVGARSGHRWCHLVADTFEELQAIAQRIGLRRDWLQFGGDGFPHYDLVPARREAAVRAGAIEISRKEVVAVRQRWRVEKARAIAEASTPHHQSPAGGNR